jgi:catechol 2,3-dioxygenase-like lactoylglutathione lyase family enzyme
MLGHLGLNVPDLLAAKRYYDAIMPMLGFTEFVDSTDEFAYRPAGGKPGTYLFFYPAAEKSTDDQRYSRHHTGLQHLAFMMRSRTAVDDVYLAVTRMMPELGGRVLHEPQHFPQYASPPQRAYYATFWLDPWDFMLEAVCHHERE